MRRRDLSVLGVAVLLAASGSGCRSEDSSDSSAPDDEAPAIDHAGADGAADPQTSEGSSGGGDDSDGDGANEDPAGNDEADRRVPDPETDSVPPDDVSVFDASIPPEGLRAQFDRAVGGDLVDPCGAKELGRPEVEDPPLAHFGLQGTYDGSWTEFEIGTAPSWCAYDFEVGAVIEVTVAAPDGGVTVSETVLRDELGECSWSCSLAESLQPVSSDGAHFAGYSRRDGGAIGELSGWIPVGAPLGRYEVSAEQMSSTGLRTSESSFTVVPASTPGVALVEIAPESPSMVASVVGHPAASTVSLGLYVETSAPCDGSDCDGDVETVWEFVERLPDIDTDARGEAVLEIDRSRLELGRYCVVSPLTIPAGVDRFDDPCFYLSKSPGAFNRTWLPIDERPGVEVVTTTRQPVVPSPDGDEFIILDFESARLVDIDGSELARLPGRYQSASFDPGGSSAVLATGDGVVAWDLATGESARQDWDVRFATPVVVDAVGGAYFTDDAGVRYWDIANQTVDPVVDLAGVENFDVGLDGESITVRDSDTVWWLQPGSVEWTEIPTSSPAPRAELSDVGDVLLVVDGNDIALWRVGTNPMRLPIEGHVGATISGDGDSVLTWGASGVTLWSSDGRFVSDLPVPSSEAVGSATLSADGTTVLTGSSFGRVVRDLPG